MCGRNGEAPADRRAAVARGLHRPTLEAARISATCHTPQMLLLDGYRANGSEPWGILDFAELTVIDPNLAT